MYYGFYYDWTYILVLIGVVLSLLASSQVKGTFAKYSKIRSYSGMTGREAAEQILRRNLRRVKIRILKNLMIRQ